MTWYSLHLHSSSIFFYFFFAAFVRCDKVPKWYSLHSPCSNFFLFFLSLSLCGVTRCPSGIHYIHMVVVCIHTGRTSFFTETFTETRLHSQKLVYIHRNSNTTTASVHWPKWCSLHSHGSSMYSYNGQLELAYQTKIWKNRKQKSKFARVGDKAVSTYKNLDFFLLMYISWYKDLGFFCSESKNQSSQESVIRQCQCTKI